MKHHIRYFERFPISQFNDRSTQPNLYFLKIIEFSHYNEYGVMKTSRGSTKGFQQELALSRGFRRGLVWAKDSKQPLCLDLGKLPYKFKSACQQPNQECFIAKCAFISERERSFLSKHPLWNSNLQPPFHGFQNNNVRTQT